MPVHGPILRAAVPYPWDADTDDIADAVPVLPVAAAGGRGLPLRIETEIPTTLRKVEQPRFRSSYRSKNEILKRESRRRMGTWKGGDDARGRGGGEADVERERPRARGRGRRRADL